MSMVFLSFYIIDISIIYWKLFFPNYCYVGFQVHGMTSGLNLETYAKLLYVKINIIYKMEMIRMRFFGPTQKDIWRIFCNDINGEFIDLDNFFQWMRGKKNI